MAPDSKVYIVTVPPVSVETLNPAAKENMHGDFVMNIHFLRGMKFIVFYIYIQLSCLM